MVRAYRVIGHLEADLDPLKHHAAARRIRSSIPRFYGFHDADLDRPIFIDGVLGLETATPRQMVEMLQAHLLRPHRL